MSLLEFWLIWPPATSRTDFAQNGDAEAWVGKAQVLKQEALNWNRGLCSSSMTQSLSLYLLSITSVFQAAGWQRLRKEQQNQTDLGFLRATLDLRKELKNIFKESTRKTFELGF